MKHPTIESVRPSVQVFPTPSLESDGTIEWDRTTVILVEVQAGGVTGLGYSYGDASAAKIIHGTLSEQLVGEDPHATEKLWLRMVSRVRNLGRPGVASHAISAVDTALWDLKAKLLGLPLYRLLGAAREEIPAYGSGGFTSMTPQELEEQLGGWARQGMKQVKMKVGRHPDQDAERVAIARKAIGSGVELFVDANGAYDARTAIRMAEEFATRNVTWFEEPVSSDDLEGLRFIRERSPSGMRIAAGEYGYDPVYFRRMLEARAVDVLQADATRCLGVTGFLKAGALAQASMLPLSAHTSPTLHAHLACALPSAINVEYFADHARIEAELFEGALAPIDGTLRPDPFQPGLGIEIRKYVARRTAA